MEITFVFQGLGMSKLSPDHQHAFDDIEKTMFVSCIFVAERLKSAESLSAIQFFNVKIMTFKLFSFGLFDPTNGGKKIPKVPMVSCTCNSALRLRLFCCSRKRAWKMVDNPKVKPLGVVAGFFPQWHGCQKRIDNLSEEMLKFPSSETTKDFQTPGLKQLHLLNFLLLNSKGEVKKSHLTPALL